MRATSARKIRAVLVGAERTAPYYNVMKTSGSGYGVAPLLGGTVGSLRIVTLITMLVAMIIAMLIAMLITMRITIQIAARIAVLKCHECYGTTCLISCFYGAAA